MKKIKLVMIVMLISFSMVAFSNTDGTRGKKASRQVQDKSNDLEQMRHHYLNTQQTWQIPELVISTHQQYNRSFLNGEQKSFTITVYALNAIYHITGSYNDWMWFFDDTGIIFLGNRKGIN